MHDQPEFLTQAEAAKLARCTPRFLQKRRRAGDGPPIVRLGVRSIRYERSAFLRWLTARGEQATAPQVPAEAAGPTAA